MFVYKVTNTGLTQPYISRLKAKQRGHSILGA